MLKRTQVCSAVVLKLSQNLRQILRPFVNPILSKQKRLNFMTKVLHSKDFSLKVKTNFCLRPFVNPGTEFKLYLSLSKHYQVFHICLQN